MHKRERFYKIPCTPIPWRRAGLSGKRFFDTQKEQKEAYALYLKQTHGSDPLFYNPLEISIIFYMPKPCKVSKLAMPVYHTTKPDIDNLCKFLFDAMNEVIFTDDRIIARLIVEKKYTIDPRTEITIKEL